MKHKMIVRTAGVLLAAAAAAAALAGCGASSSSGSVPASSSQAEAAASSEAAADSEQLVGMANPIRELSSLAEVNEAVGCNMVHIGAMGVEEKGFRIIETDDLTIGEYEFAVNGTDYCLRAGRSSDDISGIYSGGKTAGMLIDEEAGVGKDGTAVTTEGRVSRWFDGDMQYTLYSSNADEAVFAAASDELKNLSMPSSAEEETASEEAGAVKCIEPLEETIFENGKPVDCTAPAYIYTDSIEEKNGKTVVNVELYTADLYDAVEISQLKPGDIIRFDGDEMEVTTIDGDADYLIINGGLENGGFDLRANEGGTYCPSLFDDAGTYTFRGNAVLTISEDVVLRDSSDVEHIVDPVVTEGLEEVKKVLASEDEYSPAFDPFNTTVRIENGVIVEIVRIYTP